MSEMSLPEAAILDIDGTLIDVRPVMHHVLNGNHDLEAFVSGTADCPPMQQAIDFCNRHVEKGRTILVVSARTPKWRTLTIRQLDRYVPHTYRGPYLRPFEDHRHDVLLKQDMFFDLSSRWDIVAAIDDHPGVVDLWNDLGIPEVEMMDFTTYDDSYLHAARKARGLK